MREFHDVVSQDFSFFSLSSEDLAIKLRSMTVNHWTCGMMKKVTMRLNGRKGMRTQWWKTRKRGTVRENGTKESSRSIAQEHMLSPFSLAHGQLFFFFTFSLSFHPHSFGVLDGRMDAWTQVRKVREWVKKRRAGKTCIKPSACLWHQRQHTVLTPLLPIDALSSPCFCWFAACIYAVH